MNAEPKPVQEIDWTTKIFCPLYDTCPDKCVENCSECMKAYKQIEKISKYDARLTRDWSE